MQPVAGIMHHVVKHEVAFPVEIHRLGVGLRVIHAVIGHDGLFARLQREIRARAGEHPDTVRHGGVVAENDVARRIRTRPRIVGVRVVGRDHTQTKAVEVVGVETVVVQDDILVVGIRTGRRRILHAAARVDLLDEDRARLGVLQLYAHIPVRAGEVHLFDGAVEDRRRIGAVEHRKPVMPGGHVEGRHAARIGQRGVDVARIAVGEFHRNALPQEGGVLFGVHDLHAERPQRIAVGIAFERRAAGGQQTG